MSKINMKTTAELKKIAKNNNILIRPFWDKQTIVNELHSNGLMLDFQLSMNDPTIKRKISKAKKELAHDLQYFSEKEYYYEMKKDDMTMTKAQFRQAFSNYRFGFDDSLLSSNESSQCESDNEFDNGHDNNNNNNIPC